MRRLIILLIVVLFISGCGGCPEHQVKINERCCVDANENNVCDIDEPVTQPNVSINVTLNETLNETINETINQTDNETINTTTTTTLPPTDCELTLLTVIKMTYHDGNESKIDALLLNSGEIKIKGFKVWIYDEESLAEEQSFFDEYLNTSEVKEFEFNLGSNNYITENNTIEMIRIAPKITGETCDAEFVYDFKLVDH